MSDANENSVGNVYTYEQYGECRILIPEGMYSRHEILRFLDTVDTLTKISAKMAIKNSLLVKGK